MRILWILYVVLCTWASLQEIGFYVSRYVTIFITYCAKNGGGKWEGRRKGGKWQSTTSCPLGWRMMSTSDTIQFSLLPVLSCVRMLLKQEWELHGCGAEQQRGTEVAVKMLSCSLHCNLQPLVVQLNQTCVNVRITKERRTDDAPNVQHDKPPAEQRAEVPPLCLCPWANISWVYEDPTGGFNDLSWNHASPLITSLSVYTKECHTMKRKEHRCRWRLYL